MGELSPLGEILGMAVGPNGGIHVGSRSGIARFGREPGIAGHSGQFYTRTLDNGSDQSDGWQRVDLVAEIDGGGAIDLYYASEQDPGLAAAVSGVFERSQSTKEKADALESMLQDRWIGPHALRASATADASARAHNAFGAPITHSVALRADAKRFLWLKLEFSSLTPRARASVREMRVYYPRLSYLRYLPALYQQDPISRDFLERFLSMFETVFGGLEATVERIPETLDAARAPIEFLDWLARWLDLAMEEDWPAAVKRRLVQKAARLYERKGTPAGLAEFIEVVTGGRAVIRESFATDKPFILGDGTLLGIDSRVSRAAVVDLPASQRTVLGQKSFLGSSELRSTTQARTDPFRSSAFRFTIWLDLPLARFRRYERGLHGIIRDNAPAHLSYDIRLVPRASLGSSTILGVNFRVTNPPPLHLGYATLGESVCVRDVLYGPELGVNRASPDLHEGPDGTSAWSDGER
jgi:phage tail-like protein